VVGLAIAVSWSGLSGRLAGWDPIALGATLIGGYPILKEALTALLQRRMTMELSMTIALGAALSIGEFFTALVIVFFVLVADVLEHRTVGRGRRAIRELLDLLPQTVTLKRDGTVVDVGFAEVRLGDLVLVRPGGRLPVDGLVECGHSFVDQSAITGESLPVEKVPGARVYAGSINQSGAMEVRVGRVGRDTAFGRIIEAVERAESTRAPIQRTADRLSAYLVYFAIGGALLTFVITRNTRSTIAVVIVAGACGVAAGTPLAILGAIGQAARRGVIVKGGIHLEVLRRMDTVVLDKSGTLTYGNPEILEVLPENGVSVTEVVAAAAIAERPSEHPIGRAILRKAAELDLAFEEPESFRYTPGRGILSSSRGEGLIVGNRALLAEHEISLPDDPAQGDPASLVFVARGSRLLGTIRIGDVLRAEALQAIEALHGLGLRTVLLTGDSRAIAEDVGHRLGVGETVANLLPDEKVAQVDRLLQEGRIVAVVGDGVNDAPALARASVGVAMGSGTDVTRECADIVLLGNNLVRFVETIFLSRRCHRIIMTNFVGTLLVDTAGVALAALGLLGPLPAAIVHVVSELVFILNSARLLPAVSLKGPDG